MQEVPGLEQAKTEAAVPRERLRYDYTYKGRDVCKTAFCVIYDVKETDILRPLTSTRTEFVPCAHGNKGNIPKHAFRLDDVRRALIFIKKYALEYGMPMPAAPRGRPDVAPVFLRYDLPNGFTYLQLGRDFINLFI